MRTSLTSLAAFVILSLCQSLLVPSLAQNRNAITNYGAIDTEPSIFEQEIGSFFNSKFGSRLFSREGPIQQPKLIAVATPDLEAQKRLRGSWKDVMRESFYSIYDYSELSLVTYKELIEMIQDQVSKKPLVLKLDDGSLGDGVLFFEALSETEIQVTLGRRTLEEVNEFAEMLAVRGIAASRIEKNKNVLKVKLNMADPQTFKLLYEIILEVIDAFEAQPALLLLEEKIEGQIRINNRAFETRHRFIAKLNGEIDHIINETPQLLLEEDEMDSSDFGSFARIGGSSYYSNISGRKDSQIILYPEFYQRLALAAGRPIEEWEAIANTAENLIRQHWMHMTSQIPKERLSQNLPWRSAEIDLMWVQNADGSISPRLIEMSVAGLHTPIESCKEQLKGLE